MGVSRKKAEQNHRKILDAAEQLFRQKGVEGVGLNELMKKAGFTQGGFYNHFASKDALVSEVLQQAMGKGWEHLTQDLEEGREQGEDPVRHEVEFYLSPEHRNDVKCGCPMAGFIAEVPRLSKADQKAYAAGLDKTFQKLADELMAQHPGLDPLEARARGVALYSQMVGSLLLSRAVAATAPELSGEILEDGRSQAKV